MESVSIETVKVRPSTPPDSDEAALIVAAQQHENSAFEKLMRRYNRRLFRAARSILRNEAEAEDAVQECYVRAFTHLHQYRPSGSFGAWLTRLAINEALMLKRRTRRTMLSLEDAESELGDSRHSSLDALVTADASSSENARQLLELAIDSLPEKFRTVFILRVVEQLTIAETAASLDLNEATVKTRLFRAQARLRTTLSQRLRREHMTLFDFGGNHCDRIVESVHARLAGAAVPRHTSRSSTWLRRNS
jgi:RNA polymerase sigma-70 factor, ECF subfamily